MRLKEFIDKNGNQVKISKTTSTVSKTSSEGFKKRFEKLLDYATKHRYSKINKVEVTKLTEDSLEFEEHYDGGAIVDYKIYIGPATEAWHIEAFTTILNAKDREKVDDVVGTGWVELLKTLRNYMMVPVTTTPEYKDLVFEDSKENFLKEFVDSKGNKVVLNKTSSSASQAAPTVSSTKGGYWERFNKLLFYHVNHKSPAVDKVIRTKVSKDGFHYTEHVRAGTTGFDKDVVVNIDLAATENWKFQTYIDGKPHIGGAGYGYVNLIKELRKYLNLPVAGTPEYTKLLTESLDSSFAEDFQVYENLWD